MSRRDEWRQPLDSEVKRWSALTYDELRTSLRDSQAYEIEFNSKKYQVEVELLEDTDQYLHVYIAVDDGALPASITPLSHSFICEKPRQAS